jgi:DNA (cytosine-5)-methyltransferase 1
VGSPRLLDLFCGAGGAAVGYHRAGFEVIGVDNRPQLNYPFPFVLGDALEYLRLRGAAGFDAIHASPPCQRWTRMQSARGNAHLHPDLVTPLRPLLAAAELPYVIENVVGAPLRRDVVLCGTQFGLAADGFELRRHRVFELSWPFGSLVPPCSHVLPAMPVFGHNPSADFYARHGRGVSIDTKRRGMGIGWMNREELREAIPPAYTELIGWQLRQHLETRPCRVEAREGTG